MNGQMGQRGRKGQTSQVLRALRPFCTLCVFLSCTDPRARPVPPDLTLQFVSTSATSPDTVAGSLYAFDADGLLQLELEIRSSDAAFAVDSSFFIAGSNEINRGLFLAFPAGRPAGSTIRVLARVSDETGFTSADSTIFTIQ